MFANLNRLLIHIVGAALACALLAYWSIRLTTPPPVSAPAPLRAAITRDPDPVLLARAFGQIEHAGPALSNIQLAGVFAAGPDSAAVFVVGDLPARAVRLGRRGRLPMRLPREPNRPRGRPCAARCRVRRRPGRTQQFETVAPNRRSPGSARPGAKDGNGSSC